MITIYYPDGKSRTCADFSFDVPRRLGHIYYSGWAGYTVEIAEMSEDGKTIYLDYAPKD